MLKTSFVLIALAFGGSMFAGCAADESQPREEGTAEARQGIRTTCGGITGRGCEGDNWCVDDPRDDCDVKHGGADCPGLCIGAPCGGFAGLGCEKGYTCVDDPRDDCDPAHGGADCSGICLYEGDVM